MWRGALGLEVRRFGLTLGATNSPLVEATTERMEVGVRGGLGVP